MEQQQRQQFDQLRVVTSARWLADDLRRADVLPVQHDLGLDLRSTSRATAWWAPMRFASRLVATTGHNPFTAPGPSWTAALPERLLGRRAFAAPLRHVVACARRHGWAAAAAVHVKAAEVKVPSLPAQTYGSLESALQAARRAGLDDDTVMQVSEVVDLVAEYRTFVVDGQPLTTSAYLVDGVTWDAWEPAQAPDTAAARAFALEVATEAAGPCAFALDVARTRTGAWVVVEANPAWSSNPYHCEPAAVVHAVLASQRLANERQDHRWAIDPWLRRTARPLHVCEDLT